MKRYCHLLFLALPVQPVWVPLPWRMEKAAIILYSCKSSKRRFL
jgi:hypothetical protein